MPASYGMSGASDAPPHADAPYGADAVLIFGLPRSGTTWLAKIFDSHPDVLYRHEPDIVHREPRLPWICAPGEVGTHTDLAREYLNQLANTRTLKSAGPPPLFHKSYRSTAARLARGGLLHTMRIAALADRRQEWSNRMPIADLAFGRNGIFPRLVIKSVSSAGRAKLFVEAWSGARAVILVRHPCGQIASVIRGIAFGKLADHKLAPDLASIPQARCFGLGAEYVRTLGTVETLAWTWALANQKMLDELGGMSRARVILYRDLAANTAHVARDLFDFAGLSWHPQTEHFIEPRRVSRHAAEQYYGLRRDPQYTAQAWRDELADGDQRRILAIARRVEVGRLFT